MGGSGEICRQKRRKILNNNYNNVHKNNNIKKYPISVFLSMVVPALPSLKRFALLVRQVGGACLAGRPADDVVQPAHDLAGVLLGAFQVVALVLQMGMVVGELDVIGVVALVAVTSEGDYDPDHPAAAPPLQDVALHHGFRSVGDGLLATAQPKQLLCGGAEDAAAMRGAAAAAAGRTCVGHIGAAEYLDPVLREREHDVHARPHATREQAHVVEFLIKPGGFDQTQLATEWLVRLWSLALEIAQGTGAATGRRAAVGVLPPPAVLAYDVKLLGVVGAQ